MMNPSKQIASTNTNEEITPVLYWKRQLAIDAPILEMPSDFPRALNALFRPKSMTFSLSATCRDTLKRLSSQQDTTLNTVLLAAYNVLLFRYTKQKAITIGLPGIKNIFSKTDRKAYTLRYTKIFQTDLSADLTFPELLKRVQRGVVNGGGEKEESYEELLDGVKLARGINCGNLYNVVFSFRSENVKYLEYNDWIPNVNIQKRPSDPVELALDVEETMKGLNTVWTYNAALFHPATIKKLTNHFEALLTSIVSNPEWALSRL